MPYQKTNRYQKLLADNLRVVFPESEVKVEWTAMRSEEGLYSPRLDIAIGPFATEHRRCTAEYDKLLGGHQALIRNLYNFHMQNLAIYGNAECSTSFKDACEKNRNARCFLAIEIENAVSRKHLMGGAINAAALGRIGIAVGWAQDKVQALVKLRNYLLFLASVGKNTFDPINLLILGRSQVMSAVIGAARQ